MAFATTRAAQQHLGHLEPRSVSPPLCTQPADDLDLDQPSEGLDTYEMGDVVPISREVVPPRLLLVQEEDLQEPVKSKPST